MLGKAFGKLHFIVAPRSDDIISRKEDLFVKYAVRLSDQHQQ